MNEGFFFLFLSFFGLFFLLNINVVVVYLDAMFIIFVVIFYCIVGEVIFCYFKIGVDDYL